MTFKPQINPIFGNIRYIYIICSSNENPYYGMIIRDKKMVNVILTVLADQESRDIFNIIKEKPVSAQEILRDTKIPHTSFYRKINWMLNNKLVIVNSVQETKEGKKYSMFRAIFNDINIKVQRDVITIEANPTVDLAKIVANEFFEL